MRRAAFLSVLIAGLITSLVAFAADPITGTIEARKVVTSDKGQEQFVSANEVRPQDVIEYRLTYANNGDQDATGVVLTETVPTGSTFVGPDDWTCVDDTCTLLIGDLAAVRDVQGW